MLRPAFLGFLGLGAGTAGYVLYRENEVNSLQRKKKDLEKSVSQDKQELRAYENLLVEQQSLVMALQQQGAMEREAIAELDKSIQEAKLKVERLEAQQKQKQDEVKRLEQEAADAAAKAVSLRSQAGELLEKTSATENNIKRMQEEVMKAKQLVNPLNHPKVKNLLGRSSSP